MSNMQICRVCGQELPISQFRLSRSGNPINTCRECVSAKYHATCVNKRAKIGGGGKTPPFSDPDFDGKSLREVMDMMSRAKRWLESRGCVINLSGEYHETKIRKLKFE